MLSIDKAAVDKLASMISQSKYTVVLTGAGMSTESGVPDFRSKDGWWRKINPAEVASIDALVNNYELFREFYKHRFNALASCHPNMGHKILAGWEKKGFVKAIATQNIDGFHSEAGSKKVYELHGSINRIRCFSCGEEDEKESFINNGSCRACGSVLRPGVVLFGESLPAEAWESAYNEIGKSNLLLVIGTSLNVSPVNSLPFVAKERKVLINMEATEFDDRFDLTIKGKAGEILKETADRLEKM